MSAELILRLASSNRQIFGMSRTNSKRYDLYFLSQRDHESTRQQVEDVNDAEMINHYIIASAHVSRLMFIFLFRIYIFLISKNFNCYFSCKDN